MIKPTVHMNGTSREALIEGYEKAGQAVYVAMKAVVAAGPNARDYYPQGPDAFGTASLEHVARLDALRKVYEELVQLFESAMDS